MAVPLPAQQTRAPTRSFAEPDAAFGAASGGGDLVVDKARHAFNLMVSPGRLVCMKGEVVPALAYASFKPGLCGNSAKMGRGQGFVAALMGRGYQPIPHNRPLTAWGVTRQEAAPSTYCKEWDVKIKGTDVMAKHYATAWWKPSWVGAKARWVHDDAGYLEFLCGVRDDMLGELSEAQIMLACDPVLRALRAISHRADPAAITDRRKLSLTLPADVRGLPEYRDLVIAEEG